jgi:hypothetical protein
VRCLSYYGLMSWASSRAARSIAGAIGIFAAYAALSVAFMWPLAARLSSVVPYDLGDPLILTWVLWWNARATPFTSAWLDAPIFYPSTGTILYTDALLGVWPVTTSLQWLGVTPLAAHNLLVIASFALSAFTAYLLCARLFWDRGAAFAGGLAYGFAVYRVAQIVHLHILLTYWIPLILLGLHEYFATRRRAWLLLAGGAWAAQGLTSGYFLVYGAILVALWAIYFLRFEVLRWLEVAAAFGLALLATWPWWSLYRSVHAKYGFERGIGEAELYGADVMSVTYAPPSLTLWGQWLGAGTSENQCFPGFVLAAVCVAVILSSRYRQTPRWSRASTILIVVAAIFGAIAAVAALSPISFEIAGLHVSLTRPYKPLAWVWLSLVFAFVVSPPVRRVLRDRGIAGFYVLTAIALWILSLGPTVKIMGHRVWYKAPYSWLYVLPGADAVRAPARLRMIVVLALSVLVAYGLTKLRRRSAGVAWFATACVSAALLVEAWPGRLPLHAPPDRFPEIERRTAEDALPLLELPLEPHLDNIAVMYRGMYHGRALINGASGYYPASFGYLAVGLRVGDVASLIPFAERTSFDVLIRKQPHGAGDSLNVVRGIGAELIADTERLRIYRVHRRPAADESPPSAAAAIARIVLGGDEDVTLQLSDPRRPANLETRHLDISLAAPCRVDEVQLGVAPGLARVTVTAAGESAGELWSGGVAEHGVRAALNNPRHPRLRLRFAPRLVERLVIESHRAPGDDPFPLVRSVAVFGPDCADQRAAREGGTGLSAGRRRQ